MRMTNWRKTEKIIRNKTTFILKVIDSIVTCIYTNSMFRHCLTEFDVYYYQNKQFVCKNNRKETCDVFIMPAF